MDSILRKLHMGHFLLDYHGFRAMIKRTVERHNKRSANLGLPKRTKRHTYTFIQIPRPDQG